MSIDISLQKALHAIAATLGRPSRAYDAARAQHRELAPYASPKDVVRALRPGSTLQRFERDALLVVVLTEHQRAPEPVWQSTLLAAFSIESTDKVVTATRATLIGVVAEQRSNRQTWGAAARQVTATVKVISQGSADTVQALGFDVVTRGGGLAGSGALQNPGASGSIVHFRVAAQDPKAPSGQSPWSDWCACTVG